MTCSLAWNAGAATVTDEARNVVDVTFNNCSDPGVRIDMTRFRVEPWFLWQLTVAATYVVVVISFFCFFFLRLAFLRCVCVGRVARGLMADGGVCCRGYDSAVWRTKNMYETAGWTTSQGATAWHFAGGAGHAVSGAPSGTLEDCLRLNTCVSN